MWLKLNCLALNDITQLDKSWYLFVKYEDLILNKEHELSRIFNFLDLNPKHKSTQEKIIQQNISYKNTTTKGNSLNKWKKQLTSNEIATIENLITEEKEKYDYIMRNTLLN